MEDAMKEGKEETGERDAYQDFLRDITRETPEEDILIHLLDPGDAIYYDSTVPHLVKCHGDKTTRILAVLYTER